MSSLAVPECPACRRRGTANQWVNHHQLRRNSAKQGNRLVEEHWTKVLQANEKARMYNKHCNCRKSRYRPSGKTIKTTKKDIDVTHTVSSVSSLFRRFCLWLNSKLKQQESNIDRNYNTGEPLFIHNVTSGETTTDSEYDSDAIQIRLGRYQNCLDNTSISESDDPNYVYIRNKVHPSAQTQCEDKTGKYLQVPSFFQQKGNWCRSRSSLSKNKKKHHSCSEDRRLLTGTTTCHTKSHSTSRHPDNNAERASPEFYSTWPLYRKRNSHNEEDIESVFEEDGSTARLNSEDNHEAEGEFVIPYKDVEFGDVLRQGRQCSIYNGRWHGDVYIHYYGCLKREEKKEFWDVVTQLHRIRHENIALFMGAITEKQHFAVVLSIPDGVSLYDQIHIRQDKLNLQTKLQCLRLIVNGIGYLHAKGIVIKSLSTKNVFLCPKARISLVDFGFAEKKHDRSRYACVPRGHLTYIAPEVLSTMKVVPPQLVTSASYTLRTDVFAFGTVMYELLVGKYPFYGKQPESIIWNVCKGHRQCLDALTTPPRVLVNLMEYCWSHEPSERPSFADISRELHRNVALHKRHSTSQPEQLNRMLDYNCFV